MRAAVFNDQRRLDLQDRSVPDPEPGWVRLKVAAVGICGTDLHFFHGKLGQVAGLQPGHEVAGYVDALGDGVNLAANALMALEPVTFCGACRSCLAGQYNRCAKSRLFGVSRRGGMAEYMTVPADRLYSIDPSIPAHVAALAEPMAVCVRGVSMAKVERDSHVAILGSGSIGLLSIVAAQAAGAANVSVTARHPQQRALAKALGANVYDSVDALLAAVGDDAIETVIETVGGSADTLTEAVTLVRRGGQVVLLGVFEGAPRLPAMPFFSKEVTVKASNCYSHTAGNSDFGEGVAVLHANAARIAPLVTHRFGLAEINDAFTAASDKSSGSIKVQVEPQR